jgi:hypothetical protein
MPTNRSVIDDPQICGGTAAFDPLANVASIAAKAAGVIEIVTTGTAPSCCYLGCLTSADYRRLR